ncbi:hypothetical protein [Shimia biformata]|nr:hypothetical protein [Shimia biformata]
MQNLVLLSKKHVFIQWLGNDLGRWGGIGSGIETQGGGFNFDEKFGT